MKKALEIPLDLYYDPKQCPTQDAEIILDYCVIGELLLKYWDDIQHLDRDQACGKVVELALKDKAIQAVKKYEIVDKTTSPE